MSPIGCNIAAVGVGAIGLILAVLPNIYNVLVNPVADPRGVNDVDQAAPLGQDGAQNPAAGNLPRRSFEDADIGGRL